MILVANCIGLNTTKYKVDRLRSFVQEHALFLFFVYIAIAQYYETNWPGFGIMPVKPIVAILTIQLQEIELIRISHLALYYSHSP